MKSRLTERVHQLLEEQVKNGDKVIDATIGNGHDTCFLARLIGSSGTVFGLDIQQAAIDNTQKKLSSLEPRSNFHLIKQSHKYLLNVIPKDLHNNITAVTFNLGYLPGSDKSITTQPDSTLEALNAACELLKDSGIITIMAYRGHPGGNEEATAVIEWATLLSTEKFTTQTFYPDNPVGPVLIAILKRIPDN